MLYEYYTVHEIFTMLSTLFDISTTITVDYVTTSIRSKSNHKVAPLADSVPDIGLKLAGGGLRSKPILFFSCVVGLKF